PSTRLSSTVMEPNSSRRSGTRAMPIITRSSSGMTPMSCPSNCSVPREGITPISVFSSVDLPAPLGPITVTTLPGAASRFRPCSTSARPYPACRSWMRSIGAGNDVFVMSMLRAQVRRAHLGTLLYLSRRAFHEKRAELHHHQPVAHVHHQIHVVLDQQDAHALTLQLPQHVDEGAFLLEAQAGGRLVQQQQRRVRAQRPCDLQQPLLSHGQVAGEFVDPRAHADALQLALRFLEQLALLDAVQPCH